MTKDTRFAIAVRDDEGLWLVMSLRRDRKGNVHAFWPTGARAETGYHPHVSHQASGWTHFKTFDKPLLPPEQRQKPDASFSGTEHVVTTPICLQTLRGTRAFKRPCRVEKYPGGVFEIAASEISPTPPGGAAGRPAAHLSPDCGVAASHFYRRDPAYLCRLVGPGDDGRRGGQDYRISVVVGRTSHPESTLLCRFVLRSRSLFLRVEGGLHAGSPASRAARLGRPRKELRQAGHGALRARVRPHGRHRLPPGPPVGHPRGRADVGEDRACPPRVFAPARGHGGHARHHDEPPEGGLRAARQPPEDPPAEGAGGRHGHGERL